MKRIYADVSNSLKKDFKVACAIQGKTQKDVVLRLIKEEIRKSKERR